jgi:tRNA (cytosine49-C5)-methyltransferase
MNDNKEGTLLQKATQESISEPAKIPDAFLERYAPLVDDLDRFITSLQTPLAKAFRVNPLRAEVADVCDKLALHGAKLSQRQWYPEAFVCENIDPNATLQSFLGHIYVQELTSMLPPLIARDELTCADLVLDACAAPGSKTTQIAALMRNGGALFANEPNFGRTRALKGNLARCGIFNTTITNYDLLQFPDELEFDVVFVDAPCSADGTVRKSPNVLQNWRPERSLKYMNLQKQLIRKGFELLRPGGALVYSTCSLSPLENEVVVDFLLRNFAATVEWTPAPHFHLTPGLNEFDGQTFRPEVERAARVWPHHNDTNGFFFCKNSQE